MKHCAFSVLILLLLGCRKDHSSYEQRAVTEHILKTMDKRGLDFDSGYIPVSWDTLLGFPQRVDGAYLALNSASGLFQYLLHADGKLLPVELLAGQSLAALPGGLGIRWSRQDACQLLRQ